MKGLGYLHSRSGEKGRGRGRRSMPVGSWMGGTFITGSGGRLTAVRNRLLKLDAF